MQYNCVYIDREVLKLYGMSSEMADTITQNSAVNKQGRLPTLVVTLFL